VKPGSHNLICTSHDKNVDCVCAEGSPYIDQIKEIELDCMVDLFIMLLVVVILVENGSPLIGFEQLGHGMA